MSLLSRAGTWLLRKALGIVAEEVEERLEPKDEAFPLSHKDVEHQQDQIRAATVAPLCPKLRGNRGLFNCYTCGALSTSEYDHLTHKCPEPTSPRAIVPTVTQMRPPPRKHRGK